MVHTDPQAIRIIYTNYKGETQNRYIKPLKMWFGATEYHREEQWLLHAWDYEKGDFRDFAMKDIKEWSPAPTPAVHPIVLPSQDLIDEQTIPNPKSDKRWYCPECGSEETRNFCSMCGAEKP